MPRPGRMTTERAKDFKGSLLQLLRAMGNTVYVLPPYCITGAELDRIYDAIEEATELVG